jgi:Tfp pilus assembly protein PilE
LRAWHKTTFLSFHTLGVNQIRKRLAPEPRSTLSERGINMVDLMMWLVIAAMLLAAALQGINYYQQAAYAYQAKSDLASAHTWAAAQVAENTSVPTAGDMKDALLSGDLKLTSDNIGVIATSGGAKYCIGVTAPSVKKQKTFFSSSESISDVQRGDEMGAICGTPSSVTSGGSITSGGSVVTDGSTALPSVSTARLRFGVSEPNGPLSTQVDDVARLVDEYPSIVATYKDWTQPFNKTEVDAVYSDDAQAMITWEPFVAGAGVDQPNYQLKDITAGTHDAYIKTWTDSIAATNYDKPIMIRFAHEMNGNWYPWSEQVNGNAAGDYKAAWNYVHGKFTAAGIQDKVDFVWSPNIPYTGSTEFWKIYPGDATVDIVGIDGFNWGDTATFDWQDPWTVFGAGLWHARDVPTNKPILIGETGSAPSQASYSQQKWIGDLVTWLNSAENSDVIGFVWFDHMKGDELDLGEGMTNWRIDASQETVDAMKNALASRR